jgi:hypothetical protein
LICGVLAFSADSEVSLSVIERIVVDVVANEMSRGVGYLAVHSNLDFVVHTDGVKGVGLFCGGPFIADECRVIFWVNESEFALGERNFSESKTISQPAIKENGPEP